MKVLRSSIKGIGIGGLLAIAVFIGVAIIGLPLNASALSLSTLANTGPQSPSAMTVDAAGNVYVVAGLSGQNVGISKVSGGGLISVYANTGVQYTNGFTAGEGYLFWGNANSGSVTDTQIFRASESGAGPINVIYNSPSRQFIFDISDLVYSDGYLYSADYAGGRIGKLDINGNYLGSMAYLGFSGEQYVSVAVGGSKIFEGHQSGIYSVGIGGGSLSLLASGNFFDIAYLNGMVYAIGGDHDSLWQVNATSGAASLLIGGADFGSVDSIAAYGGMLYMTDSGLHKVWQVDLNAEPVPEPATMLLLGSGLAGLAGFRRKMKTSGQ